MTELLARTAFIGFGEAGQAFAEQWGANAAGVRAFDIKTDDPATADGKKADYRRFGVTGTATLAEAIDEAELILSVVTADQQTKAAQAAARCIKPGALYCDLNSVAPHSKAGAAALIEAAGGRYVDVAVMAPVRPAQLKVPLLASGPHAADGGAALRAIGFSPREIEGPVGAASTIKMLRSVMVKGLEALTAECFLAARAAGVAEEVAAYLNASWPGVDWAEKADYNLDRMMVHGVRRAAEMDEVAATIAHLGLPAGMTRATAEAQRRIGKLGLAVVDGLPAKADAILAASGAAR